MSTHRLLALATACAGAAFLTLVLRIAHPHHRQLAMMIYGLGWIPFVLSILRARAEYTKEVAKLRAWRGHLLVGLAVGSLGWAFWVLIPVESSPLREVEEELLPATLDADRQHLAFLDAKMGEIVVQLQTTPLVNATELSTSEAQELRSLWVRFMDASFELELLKRRYRAFYQVNGFTHPKLHAQAFLIAYGAHVSQYSSGAIVTARLGRHETAKKLLDDAHPDAGLPSGSFARIQLAVSLPDEILRLNAGRAYLVIMKPRLENDYPGLATITEGLSKIDRLVLEGGSVFMKNPLDILEHEASDAWFPVQKGVALGMASVRTVGREYFISKADLDAEAAGLLAGDILLTRREWHLTNLGIPGYWTHAALHIGPMKQLDTYFADLEELKGTSPSEVIAERFPAVHAELVVADSTGATPSVIEALRPGVVLQSLYASAGADSLAVLRPKISKSERWKAVLSALPHHGKPYNYQFDFRTESALVCSQLVYKAYETIEGLQLEPKMNSGRLLLSPNEIAEKFDRELGLDKSELDLVLFLDGVGVGEVVKRGAEEFRGSWSRPKWHIVFEKERD